MQNKKFFGKVINFIKEAITELKKVVWPNRKDLKNSTIVVISTIIISSVFVGVIDLVFVRLLTFIIK
ncbi:MAG TPA: preprotein translocase subunit SecE [Candidatus Atribacteria bacterium]|nr:preprotein translocase subunit SecE [Candidatus Atribacteria bacterium]